MTYTCSHCHSSPHQPGCPIERYNAIMDRIHPDAKKVLDILGKEYPTETLVAKLRGRAGGLRPSKPAKDGLVQYIWRMARFHSGQDPTMPMTATWNLNPWLEAHGLDRIVALLSERDKQILDVLEAQIDIVLLALGEDPNRGAMVWGRALGILP